MNPLYGVQKTALGSKHQRKMKLSFLGQRSALNLRQTYWVLEEKKRRGKKITEQETIPGIVEKLDAQCGFLCKKCSWLPKLFYFLRTSTCFNHPNLLEKYDKTVRDELSKVCNVDFDNFSSNHLPLPAEKGSLGVSSASSLEFSSF